MSCVTSHLWTKCKILIGYRNAEMILAFSFFQFSLVILVKKYDFNEQFIKPEWTHKGIMSIHLLHEGFKSGR